MLHETCRDLEREEAIGEVVLGSYMKGLRYVSMFVTLCYKCFFTKTMRGRVGLDSKLYMGEYYVHGETERIWKLALQRGRRVRDWE